MVINMVENNNNEDTKKEVKKNTKKASQDLFLEYMPYIIIIFFVVIIRLFIATPISVKGSSMKPTLQNGDTMILYKLTKHIRGIKRFDIVVIKTDSGDLIKRVIGLPGDKIRYEVKYGNEEKTGVLTVNGKVVEEKFLTTAKKIGTCETNWTICNEEITVPEGEYFVMGDNRDDSKDSRMIGTVPLKDIKGTTEIILFPFNRFGKVKKYSE